MLVFSKCSTLSTATSKGVPQPADTRSAVNAGPVRGLTLPMSHDCQVNAAKSIGPRGPQVGILQYKQPHEAQEYVIETSFLCCQAPGPVSCELSIQLPPSC